MSAQTIWAAYRKARSIASIHLWDRKARRQELAFQARLERIVAEYDAMKVELDAFKDGSWGILPRVKRRGEHA